MADDDIDFNITFPTKLGNDRLCDNNDKEPVIVLLGWAGCEDKYLSKYSKSIYDLKGCVTLRFTAPLEDITFQSGNLRKKAEKLLELLADLGLSTNPLFVHVFSNGGGRLYRYISEIIHNELPSHGNQQLCGTIFDSCPSIPSPWIAAKVTFQTMKRNVVIRFVCAVSMYVFCLMAPVVEKLLSPFKPTRLADWSDYWNALSTDRARCPQLFLYSKADKLIDYRGVEKFASLRRKAGVEVQQDCWLDSPHVQHFRCHPTDYTQRCWSFVDMCLLRLSERKLK